MKSVLMAIAFVSVVSGFAPPLRPFAAELWRDRAAAQGAKAGSGTLSQTPSAEMRRVPQFDNDRAVSWKSIIPPRAESTLHRHDGFRTVIGIVGGDLTTVDPDGRKTVTHYETGKSYWQEPMPPGAMHKDLNETNNTIELVVVENK